jgi:hypothetical protein
MTRHNRVFLFALVCACHLAHIPCSLGQQDSPEVAATHSNAQLGIFLFGGTSRTQTEGQGLMEMRGTTTWAYGGEVRYAMPVAKRWHLVTALQVERWRIRMFTSFPHEQPDLIALGLNPYQDDNWWDFTSLSLPVGISRRHAMAQGRFWQVSGGIKYRWTIFPLPSDENMGFGRFLLENQDPIFLVERSYDIQRHHVSGWMEGGIYYPLPFSAYHDGLHLALRLEASPMMLAAGNLTYFPQEAYEARGQGRFRGAMATLRLGLVFGRRE